MRTLLAEPRALLLDEPFGKLDAPLREDFRRFVFDHARERALPVLLVTHDAADARGGGRPGTALRRGGAVARLISNRPATPLAAGRRVRPTSSYIVRPRGAP